MNNGEIRKKERGVMVEYWSGEKQFIAMTQIPRAPLMMRTGAIVEYCGHGGTFVADLYQIEDAVVVRASGPVNPDNLDRSGRRPTHHVRDYPVPTFWRPDLGVFVVPMAQILLEEK